MTALNWALLESEVMLVSDTLVIGADDRLPLYFTTKALHVAHARTLIAGTGAAAVVTRAAMLVTEHAICRHVMDISRSLSDVLPRCAEDIPQSLTSTVYVFGWDDDESKMKGFAYRSTKDFVLEELPYGLGIKPQVAVNPETVDLSDDFFVRLVVAQRAADDQRPTQERVGIGGEIVAMHLTEDWMMSRTIFCFSDYPAMFNAATARLDT